MKIRCTDRTESFAKVLLEHADAPTAAIEGHIRGPYCDYSRTLTAKCPVQGGQAAIVDPCYWTPKLPFLYEANLAIETDRGTEELQFRFGLRRWQIDGARLRLNGKATVVRGVAGSGEVDLEAFRANSACLWMTEYRPEVMQAASKQGVAVVYHGTPLTPEQLEEVASYPALAFATMDDAATGSTDVLPLSSGEHKRSHVAVTHESEISPGTHDSAMFVTRHSTASDVDDRIRELRQQCDKLQRDLAPIGQFAGYVVLGQ